MNAFDDDDIRQLLADPKFLKWVEQPDEELDTYWREWLEAFPCKKEKLLLAKEFLVTLQEDSLELSVQETQKNINRILNRIPQSPRTHPFPFLRVAAAALVVLGFAFFFEKQPTAVSKEGEPGHSVSLSAPETFRYENTTRSTRLISLDDGSTVLLQPESRITYHATDHTRNVFLEGEAFFEITKNAAWPFAVKTQHLTMYVLGTSFRVRDLDSRPPFVRVNTGKVAVSLNQAILGGDDSTSSREAIVLASKEVITYQASDRKLVLQTPSHPPVDLDLLPVETIEHVYKRTPVAVVFDGLIASYGVRIHYDSKRLENCSLTARLGDEPLLEKLRMICLGLGLSLQQTGEDSYEITGPGC